MEVVCVYVGQRVWLLEMKEHGGKADSSDPLELHMDCRGLSFRSAGANCFLIDHIPSKIHSQQLQCLPTLHSIHGSCLPQTTVDVQCERQIEMGQWG